MDVDPREGESLIYARILVLSIKDTPQTILLDANGSVWRQCIEFKPPKFFYLKCRCRNHNEVQIVNSLLRTPKMFGGRKLERWKWQATKWKEERNEAVEIEIKGLQASTHMKNWEIVLVEPIESINLKVG